MSERFVDDDLEFMELVPEEPPVDAGGLNEPDKGNKGT